MKSKQLAILLSVTLLSCVASIWLLYRSSNVIMASHNPFIRRFPPYPAEEVRRLDIQFDSYYIAGIDSSRIYLGNRTAPLHMIAADTGLSFFVEHRLRLPVTGHRYRSLKLEVHPPHFYIADGSVPTVFRGRTFNWKVEREFPQRTFFSQSAIIDTGSIAFRGRHPQTDNSEIGTIDLATGTSVYEPGILEKQIDGIFDTDGSLHYNEQLKRIVYLYRYRNQYLMAGPQLGNIRRGQTIDTNSTAKLKITYVKSQDLSQFAEPPVVVNKFVHSYRNLLFVNSAQLGKYESEKMWKQASVIDVYDLADDTYVCSFYIYHIKGKKMKGFRVHGGHLYAVVGHHLVDYKFSKTITQRYR